VRLANLALRDCDERGIHATGVCDADVQEAITAACNSLEGWANVWGNREPGLTLACVDGLESAALALREEQHSRAWGVLMLVQEVLDGPLCQPESAHAT
jgi:hypothetical protein